jgi:hypothetical protein
VKRSFLTNHKMRNNLMIEEFEGILTDGIWLRLNIEDAVSSLQSLGVELTAQSVARFLIDDGYQGKLTLDKLLEVCEEYLQRYSDPFYGLGDINVDLNVLTEHRKNALFTAVTAKSELLKAHAAKIDAYVIAKGDEPMAIQSGSKLSR